MNLPENSFRNSGNFDWDKLYGPLNWISMLSELNEICLE